MLMGMQAVGKYGISTSDDWRLGDNIIIAPHIRAGRIQIECKAQAKIMSVWIGSSASGN